MRDKQGISVIICTYNGQKQLDTTFQHLFKQQNLENIAWEIIIVNNNSTDNTDAVIEFIVKHNLTHTIKYLKQPIPGKLAALKMAINHAEFKYLVICDDDNWLDDNYLITSYNFMEMNRDIGVTGGKGVPVNVNSLPHWIFPYLHNYAAAEQWSTTADITKVIGSVYGAGMVIRKEIYQKVFDKKWPLYLSAIRKNKNLLSGEDTEICYIARLLGYKIYYNENLTFKHNFPLSKINKSYLLRLIYFFGVGAAILSPYIEIENNHKKSPFMIKILIEIYRLIRYDFINLIRKSDFDRKKKLIYRWGYIKGLFYNRKNIKELQIYLQEYIQIESPSSHL